MEKHIISPESSIKEALNKINELTFLKDAPLLLLVVDKDYKLIGTLTDGDIRRGLMKSDNLMVPVSTIMNTNFHFIKRNKEAVSEFNKLKKMEIWSVPLLDDDFKILELINLKVQKSILPVDAVIMAGGKGQRLYPLTKDTPKPMLKVGEKPIIQINVERLLKYGINKVNISVNYLAEVIENYFESHFSTNQISFVKELVPMGTLGSISLIEQFNNDYVLLMNSDLLTDIDFEDFFEELLRNKADMVIASIPHRMAVPYAVFETDGKEIKKLSEKPTYTYHANAGIYLFKKEFLKFVPKNSFFNATDLVQLMIDNKCKVIYYDIVGYWLDIGSPEDFEKAQQDVNHLEL